MKEGDPIPVLLLQQESEQTKDRIAMHAFSYNIMRQDEIHQYKFMARNTFVLFP